MWKLIVARRLNVVEPQPDSSLAYLTDKVGTVVVGVLALAVAIGVNVYVGRHSWMPSWFRLGEVVFLFFAPWCKVTIRRDGIVIRRWYGFMPLGTAERLAVGGRFGWVVDSIDGVEYREVTYWIDDSTRAVTRVSCFRDQGVVDVLNRELRRLGLGPCRVERDVVKEGA